MGHHSNIKQIKIMRISVCIFIFLWLATLSQAANLYNGYEQPQYTVLESNEDYELRKYPSSTWISADTNGANYDDTSSSNFWKLFGYISGGNDANQKIDMTTPVITSMRTRSCSFCDMIFTMNFYIPQTIVDSNVPIPTDGRVQIVNMPETQVMFDDLADMLAVMISFHK